MKWKRIRLEMARVAHFVRDAELSRRRSSDPVVYLSIYLIEVDHNNIRCRTSQFQKACKATIHGEVLTYSQAMQEAKRATIVQQAAKCAGSVKQHHLLMGWQSCGMLLFIYIPSKYSIV